jgi:uracil-DNA glycosylase
MKDVEIEPSWKRALHAEFDKQYFKDLTVFVKDQYASTDVFPHPKNIFNAFALTPFDQVKVVILGQDPYHGKGQAHGLSFSVQDGIRVPPSLRNIYTEIKTDLGITPNASIGDLTRWASQGVLLLNATLTVEKGKPGSHQGQGWEQFTDAVIQSLSDSDNHIVFILWGNYARAKGSKIDRTKHLVIESAHPSPFSAHSGFFGSRPFSSANAYLRAHGTEEIDWH